MNADIDAGPIGPTGSADWNDTLRSLELALASGDAAQVAQVALAASLGPVPPDLGGRAEVVLAGIGRLEETLGERMRVISSELDRIPVRSRWGTPPAPSQLDCSA